MGRYADLHGHIILTQLTPTCNPQWRVLNGDEKQIQVLQLYVVLILCTRLSLSLFCVVNVSNVCIKYLKTNTVVYIVWSNIIALTFTPGK